MVPEVPVFFVRNARFWVPYSYVTQTYVTNTILELLRKKVFLYLPVINSPKPAILSAKSAIEQSDISAVHLNSNPSIPPNDNSRPRTAPLSNRSRQLSPNIVHPRNNSWRIKVCVNNYCTGWKEKYVIRIKTILLFIYNFNVFHLVAKSLCTYPIDSRYFIPEAICVAIYIRQP